MRKSAVGIVVLLAGVLNEVALGQGHWVASGDLNVPRATPQAVLLNDGQVLLAGGRFGDTTTELWDQESGQWQLTGSLETIRESAFSLVKLQDGRVLVIGGLGGGRPALASCEIYDPKQGTWRTTSPMNRPRQNPNAVLLQDGRVLVAGGFNSEEDVLSSAEIYDPATESWTLTAPLNVSRTGHRAVLLPDGRVLVTGGANRVSFALETAEIYDPEAMAWTLVASLNQGRTQHHMVLLQNGRVLVVGGCCLGIRFDICEEYDSVKDEWLRVSDIDMDVASATLVPDGRVLATGWRTNRGAPPTFDDVRLYDPESGSWGQLPRMPLTRYDFYAFTSLQDGAVLLAGGAKDWIAGGEETLQRHSIVYFP